MATLESLMLGHEAVRWLSNVRSNLRENAAAYKIAAARVGADLTKIAAVMTADATEILKTIEAVNGIAGDATKRAKLSEFLTVFGITIAQANGAVTELKNATTALRDAAKTSKVEIDTASDAVLSAVAEFTLPKRV